MMKPQIVETYDSTNYYTGHYRLIGIPSGIPGDYLDLPGKGGRRTQEAAKRALLAFQAGKDWFQANRAAWTRPPR